MNDTFFEVPENKRKRLLPNHRYNNRTNDIETIPNDKRYRIAAFDSGGGGLISTALDYMIFAECLRNGGVYNNKRIIGSKTLKYMIKNHLPSNVLGIGRGESPNDPSISSTTFGLGFGILNDPAVNSVIGSKGSYSWGGAAGTVFWVDPVENLVVVSMIQLMNSPWTLRNDLRVSVYQALVDSYE
jgi:CubicO group peptidase (beta-lactamase class C family)